MSYRERPISGYPGYRVTRGGVVRSVRRKDVRGYRWPGCTLKPMMGQGYKHVCLRDGPRTRRVSIHTLVLETFVGPRPPGLQARHLSGVKTNNRLSNLRWGTCKENAFDRKLHGRTYRGAAHPAAKLTERQARRIITIYQAGRRTQADLARQFGVSQTCVWRLRTGLSWKHLHSEQNRGKNHG